MKRLFSSAGGRKLQRRSGVPAELEALAIASPEDIDAPRFYQPGKALHADFWADSVRPSGYKYLNGPESRIIVPVLGMCGVGKTCLVNYLQTGYWGGVPQTKGDGSRGQAYFCDGTIYRFSTPEIPPRSPFNELLNTYANDSLTLTILITYSITSRESYVIACQIFDELRQALTKSRMLVFVMLMGLRKDRDVSRQVTRDEAESFAKQRGMLFAETSAMTGRGVRGAFGMIVEAVRKHGPMLPKGIRGGSSLERLGLDLLKQEIFRLGIQCFEETRNKRCPSYQSKWDPATKPSSKVCK